MRIYCVHIAITYCHGAYQLYQEGAKGQGERQSGGDAQCSKTEGEGKLDKKGSAQHCFVSVLDSAPIQSWVSCKWQGSCANEHSPCGLVTVHLYMPPKPSHFLRVHSSLSCDAEISLGNSHLAGIPGPANCMSPLHPGGKWMNKLWSLKAHICKFPAGGNTGWW